MSTSSPKENMQMIIQQCIHNNDWFSAYESFKIYTNTFHSDDFIQKYQPKVLPYGPLVSLICLHCTDDFVESFLEQQNYCNLEIVHATEDTSYEDIVNYIRNTSSKYICFLETNHSYTSEKIAEMVWRTEIHSGIDFTICPRNFIDSENTMIAHPDYAYENSLNNTVFQGKLLLETSLNHHVNLYGTLSTILVSVKYARQIPWQFPTDLPDSIKRISMLYQLILYGKCYYMNVPLSLPY